MNARDRHDEAHEQRLIARLLGEGERPGDGALLEACPECTERLADLAPLAHTLSEHSLEVLEADARLPAEGVDEDALVERLLQEMQGRDAQRGRPPALRVWIGLGVAAALVLTTILLRSSAPEDPAPSDPAPFYLAAGGAQDFALSFTDETPVPRALTWQAVVPRGSYTLEVRRLDELDGPPLLRVTGLIEPLWELDERARKAWKDGIRCEVFAYDELNARFGSASVEVRY